MSSHQRSASQYQASSSEYEERSSGDSSQDVSGYHDLIENFYTSVEEEAERYEADGDASPTFGLKRSAIFDLLTLADSYDELAGGFRRLAQAVSSVPHRSVKERLRLLKTSQIFPQMQYALLEVTRDFDKMLKAWSRSTGAESSGDEPEDYPEEKKKGTGNVRASKPAKAKADDDRSQGIVPHNSYDGDDGEVQEIRRIPEPSRRRPARVAVVADVVGMPTRQQMEVNSRGDLDPMERAILYGGEEQVVVPSSPVINLSRDYPVAPRTNMLARPRLSHS